MRNEQIGKALKDLRLKHNFTQAELADKLGVTYQAVSRWEKGINAPNIVTLVAISDIYKISVDQLLLKADAPERAANTSLHWSLRFFVFPILLVGLSFCISQFFLFLNTLWAMIIYALFFMFLFMIIIGFVSVKSRKLFYLIFLGTLFLGAGTLYLSNSHYYDLMEVPYFRAVNTQATDHDFAGNRPITIRFTYDTHDYVLIYHRETDKIYLYDLYADLDSMLSIIDTQGKSVSSVSVIGDLIYYSSYDDALDGCEIYRIRLDGTENQLLLSSAINLDLLTDGTALFALTRHGIFDSQPDSLYKVNGNVLENIIDFGLRVVDIVYVTEFEHYYISVIDALSTNVLLYDADFNLQYTFFGDEEREQFNLKLDENKVLTTYRGEIIRFMDTSIQETGNLGVVEDLHSTGSMFYTHSGALTDHDFNELSQNTFYNWNWSQGSGHLLFYRQNDSRYISIDQGEVTLVETYSRQVSELLIDSYLRHILFVGALPLIALIVALGVKTRNKKSFKQILNAKVN